MAITVTEKLESRRLFVSRDGRESTLTLFYNATGSMDQHAVKAAIAGVALPVWGNGLPFLWLQSIGVACIGPELWECEARYDTSGPEPLSASNSFAFDISGGSQHITQSLVTEAFPASLPDHGGAIAVTDTGVQGADVYAPEMTFEETYFFQELSPLYKGILFALKGKVNSAPFRGWNAGEVLFEGVSARRQDNRFGTPWSVTYRFRVSQNRTLIIAGQTVHKAGWHLLDIHYRQTVDDANALVHVADGAYLHEVYESADFSALSIGA